RRESTARALAVESCDRARSPETKAGKGGQLIADTMNRLQNVADTVKRCLTIPELAERWRCRVATVREMVKKGSLPTIKLGGRVRMTPEAISQAEQGSLAVRTPRRRQRERIDPEIKALLG